MRPDVHLALTKFWFAWDDAVTRKAVLAAVLERFATAAERVFDDNRAAGRHPTDWREFQQLRRNERNVRRMASGENGTTMEFLLGAAALLQMDVRELFPETAEWVALAALHIGSCDQRLALEAQGLSPREAFSRVAQGGSGPTLADAICYARVLLSLSAVDTDSPNRATVEAHLTTLATDQAKVVRAVTSAIAPVIAARDAALSRREDAR